MGHIAHGISAAVGRDLRDALIIDQSRVGARAADDELRLFFACDLLQRVIVDPSILTHTVENMVIELAEPVGRRTVCQMAALVEPHGKDLVAGLEDRRKDRMVCGRTRIALDIDMFRAEKRFRPLPCQPFQLVCDLRACLVAGTRKPFKGLIGENASGHFHDRDRHDALGCDHLDAGFLPGKFLINERRKFRIGPSCFFNMHFMVSFLFRRHYRAKRPPRINAAALIG